MYFDADTLRTILTVLHDPKTFSLRRTAIMDALTLLVSSLNAVNAVGELVDDLRFPEHHEVDVGEPIYLVAAPRSGTTFLHRLMGLDPRFSSFKLYETLLTTISAQSAIERSVAEGGALAAIIARVRGLIDEKSFGGWDGMHDTGLDADEEDEGIWTLAMATPAILLMLPFPEKFAHLRFVDRLPEEKKQKLADNYRACLQRRLYRSPGTTLLMKNVLMQGRFELVMRAAPRARFVHIVRHPYEAIPSSLSLFTLPWSVFSPAMYGDTPETRDFADLMIDYYRFLFEEERRRANDARASFAVLHYRDVLADPVAAVRSVYAAFGIPWSGTREAELAAEVARQASFKSANAYSLEQFGLTRDYIQSRLGDVMDHYGFER